MIYIASPYSAPKDCADPAGWRQQRYEEVLGVTAQLLQRGFYIYSPIVHCHPIAERHSLPTDYAFWMRYNHALIRASKALWVLHYNRNSDLVNASNGVLGEIDYALSIGTPVYRFGTKNGEVLDPEPY